jgi:hypothetical protein
MAEDKIKQRLDDINAISIAIDTYDDIFSDFDPRDLTQRDLSEDFITELTRRHRQDIKGKYDVVIVAPKSIEDPAAEKKIISRINRYFNQRYKRYAKSISELRKRGSIYIILGMALLMVLALLTYYKKLDTLMLEVIGIVFMPLGWFGIWEGFSKIVDLPFRLESDTQVYRKLSKADYKFEYI